MQTQEILENLSTAVDTAIDKSQVTQELNWEFSFRLITRCHINTRTLIILYFIPATLLHAICSQETLYLYVITISMIARKKSCTEYFLLVRVILRYWMSLKMNLVFQMQSFIL